MRKSQAERKRQNGGWSERDMKVMTEERDLKKIQSRIVHTVGIVMIRHVIIQTYLMPFRHFCIYAEQHTHTHTNIHTQCVTWFHLRIQEKRKLKLITVLLSHKTLSLFYDFLDAFHLFLFLHFLFEQFVRLFTSFFNSKWLLLRR